MRATDLKTMSAEMDAEDREVLGLFDHKKTNIDECLLLTSDTGKMSIVTKDELAMGIKRGQDLVNGITAGCAIGACLMLAALMIARVVPVMDGFVMIGAISIGSGLIGFAKMGKIGGTENAEC